MKVITDNAIQELTASSENSHYPITNLLDIYPKRKWQAGFPYVTSATITTTVAGFCNSLALVGIVADNVTVAITNPNEAIWEVGTSWETGTGWESIPPDMRIDLTLVTMPGRDDSLWVDFDEFSTTAEITITLSKEATTAEPLAAGVLYIGTKDEFVDPDYGLVKGNKDFSIELELSNGTFYYDKREVVRTISGSIVEDHFTIHKFLAISEVYGKAPLMWHVVDKFSGDEWIMYARFVSLPSAAFDNPSEGTLQFKLQEVL